MKKEKSAINYYIILLFTVFALIFAGALFGYFKAGSVKESASDASNNPPHILITPESLNWGIIKAKDGVAKREFVIKNTGKGDLIIKKISTSCGCTRASLKLSKFSKTEYFGMEHRYPNKIINKKISSGESAVLSVTFDPNFHYVRGPIERIVYIQSNDPRGEIEVVNYIVVTD